MEPGRYRRAWWPLAGPLLWLALALAALVGLGSYIYLKLVVWIDIKL